MIDAAAHDDHGPSLCLNGVLCKLPRSPDDNLCGNARISFLPFRRIRRIILIGCSSLTAQAAVDAIVGKHEVIDGRHIARTGCRLDLLHRHGTLNGAVLTFFTEVRQCNRADFIFYRQKRQLRRDFCTRFAVFFTQIPFFRFVPAVAHRAIRDNRSACKLINNEMLELRVLAFPSHIMTIQQAAWHIASILFIKQYKERHIRISFGIGNKELRRLAPIIFMQDDMAHRHGQRTIAARLDVQPGIRCRCRLCIVR